MPKKLVGNSKKVREEGVYIYSISKILEECKYLYGLIKSGKVENKSKWMKNLDFTITYYQLCSLIVDDFSDIGAFVSKSYLELILATEPQELE